VIGDAPDARVCRVISHAPGALCFSYRLGVSDGFCVPGWLGVGDGAGDGFGVDGFGV
jgi:hypothetical protein